jgi:pimeloyl-ACP methyl ester carboxylesterase
VAAAVPSGGDVVLVGHSYAGSVITGVADRLTERIAALVYLDAFLPEDGDSCWSMTNDEQRKWYVDGCATTGYGVDPLPFFDQRARPHPVATFLQALPLSGAWHAIPVKHYVAAAWPDESPMALSTQRAEADPGFIVHRWETRHNVMADGPDLVVGLPAVPTELRHRHLTDRPAARPTLSRASCMFRPMMILAGERQPGQQVSRRAGQLQGANSPCPSISKFLYQTFHSSKQMKGRMALRDLGRRPDRSSDACRSPCSHPDGNCPSGWEPQVRAPTTGSSRKPGQPGDRGRPRCRTTRSGLLQWRLECFLCPGGY